MYQARAGMLDDMEAQLAEIRRDIREKQFTAGSDRSALIRQRNRAEQLDLKIDEADRALVGIPFPEKRSWCLNR